MRTIQFRLSVLLICLGAYLGCHAQNYAWPSDWKGVMLQGFYWDSYGDTRWTNLTSQADELSTYFKLIWVPNSGKAGSGNQMGYMPQYWFTNHNSSFGTEADLRAMISAYKERGTGIIADVVINHRNGVTDWADFPVEEWNGRTWHIGLDGICRNDNLNGSGHGTPTGAYDTGDAFDGCRDLDHTNANVQDNCKNYCKFLLDDLGYAGFRYDMVKGYAGRFTKMYNEYSKPTYSVGEYFDGSYDAVKAWIDATGKQSAAFDFPFKYAVNEAFNSGDMTKLVWNAGYVTPQPAGMIHYEYQQYAVTFIDNHDTYRDDWNKFKGNVVAANAFMLCSPGAPCVFLPHYKQHKSAIQRLINIRNSVGVTNTSKVNVIQTDRSCYMAEVVGSNGKLVVKIGPAMVSPSGYSGEDIVASGADYCVWTKTAIEGGTTGGDNPGLVTAPSRLYLMGHLAQGAWQTNVGVSMTRSGNKFTASNVSITDAGEGKNLGYFAFVTSLGTTGSPDEWDAVINNSDRYGAVSKDAPVSMGGSAQMQLFMAGVDASAANSWAIPPGTYDITADFETMTVSVAAAGQGGGGDTPSGDDLYVVGYAYGINPPTDYKMDYSDGVYSIVMEDLSGGFAIAGMGLKPFYTTAGEVTLNTDYVLDSSEMQLMILKGDCENVKLEFNASTRTLNISKVSGVSDVELSDAEPEYYNLQGIRVENPSRGLYIVVRGKNVTKEYIR